MIKQHKDILAAVIRDLRHDLLGYTAKDGTAVRGDLDRELERLGVLPDGRVQPIDALPNATAPERQAHYAAEQFIDAARRQGKAASAARNEFVEQAGYSWINRLVALRALEARRLINGTLTPSEDYGGVSEALYLLAQTDPARVAAPDGGWYAVLENACAAQSAALPGLFGAGDPVLTLRPSITALRRCVERIGKGPAAATVEATDAAFADPDAIGWAYQFYQEEAKAAAFASFKVGKKADSRATIAAATQLFTEPYMVKWLLQNSLGRSYHEIHPQSALPASWEYYIRQDDRRQTMDDNADASSIVHRLSSLAALTVLDPCVGSGHFLREAFDLLAAMYREQHPDWDAQRVVETILRQHLHGIDIDPRAVQLAALTLYMRALELLRDEARLRRRPMLAWTPPQINLATTPSGLDGTALERHLQRHPADRPLRPVLERIFETLAQAEILGSLLRPGAEIDAAIAKVQSPRTRDMFAANDAADAIAQHDPAELKRLILDRIATAFRAEAGSADPADALFGREAERGVRLLQLLDRKYAVVVTNPPYMGSSNMGALLRQYVERNYKPGKRDLYAAFILRCLDLCLQGGRAAMVTQQSWMFLRSFAELRAMPEERLADARKKKEFTGLLHEMTMEALAHLGRYAFSEIGNAAVAPTMFIFRTIPATQRSLIWSCRLTAPRPSEEQARLLQKASTVGDKGTVSTLLQSILLKTPDATILYYLKGGLLEVMVSYPRLRNYMELIEGPCTGNDTRFLHFFWETINLYSWKEFPKGGGYAKWYGNRMYTLRWGQEGEFLKSHPGSIIPNEHFYNLPGLQYTEAANGSLGVRLHSKEAIPGNKAPFIHLPKERMYAYMGVLNCRVTSYFARMLATAIDFGVGPLRLVPMPELSLGLANNLAENVQLATCIKITLKSGNLLDMGASLRVFTSHVSLALLESVLTTVEGYIESLVFKAYNLTPTDISTILIDTGTPAGFHPLIAGYDALPELPAELELPALPQEVIEYLEQHERLTPSPAELARIKARLRTLYEAGYGAKDEGADDASESEGGEYDEGEVAVAGAHIPIPTETFLEELSVRMELHPITVYWLLEELRAEGVRCKPEERRLLEDRLSVLALRLLGHRWPSELDEGRTTNDERPESASSFVLRPSSFVSSSASSFVLRPSSFVSSSASSFVLRPSSFVDNDGIIPLVNLGNGEATLAERLRERLREEDDTVGAQRTEALLSELTGTTSLEDWLRRRFFERHVKQFKYRPIAWYLASKPVAAASSKSAGRRSSVVGRQPPLFECMVYYHATGGDALARLRTQYVEPLLRREESALNEALGNNNTEAAASANLRVQELREFLARIQQVERDGFACAELDTLLAKEPLDRWSGDGIAPPASRDDLLRQERAWRVDLNDGVRVNIAPIQLAGLLPGEVLRAADAKKAIADRARWRSDERRWVREGKLPRPGWLPESVPESPEWQRKASERAAEQARLEEKRRAVQKNHE